MKGQDSAAASERGGNLVQRLGGTLILSSTLGEDRDNCCNAFRQA
jgi:hypothetical protein